MTVIVGVRCTDGIVIGADSAATSTAGTSMLMRVDSNEKISIYEDLVISAATGSVGYSQRLNNQVDAAVRGGIFRGKQNAATSIANISQRFINDLSTTHLPVQLHQSIGFGSLLATVINDELYLVEYDVNRFQPEIKDGKHFYSSIGSGQTLADPFLAFISRIVWRDAMPSVDAGKFGVFWALQHTIRHAAFGVGGEPAMAILRRIEGKWRATFVLPESMGENRQYIADLEEYIHNYPLNRVRDAAIEPVPMPEG